MVSVCLSFIHVHFELLLRRINCNSCCLKKKKLKITLYELWRKTSPVTVISSLLHVVPVLVNACVILTSHGGCKPPTSFPLGFELWRSRSRSYKTHCGLMSVLLTLRHLPSSLRDTCVCADTLEHMYSTIKRGTDQTRSGKGETRRPASTPSSS